MLLIYRELNIKLTYQCDKPIKTYNNDTQNSDSKRG